MSEAGQAWFSEKNQQVGFLCIGVDSAYEDRVFSLIMGNEDEVAWKLKWLQQRRIGGEGSEMTGTTLIEWWLFIMEDEADEDEEAPAAVDKDGEWN